MAKIGSFGSLVFETSDNKILTFQNFKHDVSGRWEQHITSGSEPKSQFLGPDQEGITFKIKLSAMHGVRPREMIEKLEKMVRRGETEFMVIGGKKVGTGKWYIESISEDWSYIMSQGELVEASVSITAKSYL